MGRETIYGYYLVVRITEANSLLIHGVQDDVKGIDKVCEDDGAPLFPIGLGEAAAVNETHLLEHGGLATLASTEQENLDLAVDALLVDAELLLNLVILGGTGISVLTAETHAAQGHIQRAVTREREKESARAGSEFRVVDPRKVRSSCEVMRKKCECKRGEQRQCCIDGELKTRCRKSCCAVDVR